MARAEQISKEEVKLTGELAKAQREAPAGGGSFVEVMRVVNERRRELEEKRKQEHPQVEAALVKLNPSPEQ